VGEPDEDVEDDPGEDDHNVGREHGAHRGNLVPATDGKRGRYRRRTGFCGALAFVLALSAGCGGGTLDAEALSKEFEAVESLAAEGALLADGAARAKTMSPFTLVHAGELAQTAGEKTKRLESAQVASGLQAKAREAATLSARISELLETLGEAPDDRAGAEVVKKMLSDAAESARRLRTSL
jgi:hypothetical protein